VFDGGKLAAMAFASLDLARVAVDLARLDLPAGARVVVTDLRGRILVLHPRPPGGGPADAPGAFAGSDQGEWTDSAGHRMIFGSATTRPVSGEAFRATVTIDRTAVTTHSAAQVRAELLLRACTLLSSIALAWWIGGRWIVRPAREILGVVRRLERGRLDARVPLRGGRQRGEFYRIGAAFNLMAESLQLRQIDLETELGRSRSAYSVLDLVLNSMQEGLVAVTTTGQFLMFNEAAARLFPLHDAALLPTQWAERFGFYHPDGETPYRTDELPLVRSALGESGRQQLLVLRNEMVPQGRLVQCSWQPIRSDVGISGGLVVFTDVTEVQRLQAEQAARLRELHETQRKLIQSQRVARAGNWELDLRSGRLWWSDEVYALFGLTRAQFDGTLEGFTRWVHPDDRALLASARDAALSSGALMNLEYRVVKPEGALAWMTENAEVRHDDGGVAVWLGGMVQDITHRKLGEQALLESERELQAYTEMLQRAAEATQAIIAQPALADAVRELAEQARRVIGAWHAEVALAGGAAGAQTREDTSGGGMQVPLPLAETLSVDLVGRNGERLGQLRVTGKNEGAFTEREKYVALELAQVASIAFDNARLFAQIHQLNAGLEARIGERTAELEQQEKLYRTLAEQAPEVVWNTDANGDATFLNRAWYDLVGGRQDEWLGAAWLQRIHPDDQDEVRLNWERARDTLTAYSGTRRILGRDGIYHTMSYKAAPVLDDHGKVAFWVGIDADITRFKTIERALRASNQELEAFSYSVSHDLRAPLGAIGGFSQALMLKLKEHEDPKVQHYLARIHAGVDKMEQLIEALLSLAKVVRAPLNFGVVDLTAIARETLEGLQMQDPARQVSARVQEGLNAQGDARLLRLVMENLLGNAWKFSARSPAAEIEVGQVSGSSVYFVRDNGVGFDMAHAGKLFGAFQRLHAEGEFPGTGIGLATVRRIVARHQGRVWAISQPGQGTTFFFVLSTFAPPAWLAAQQGDPII